MPTLLGHEVTIPLTGGGTALALVGQVARMLNSGLPPDDTLRSVVSILEERLGLAQVAIWRRDPNTTTFTTIASPTESRAARNLDELPPVEAGTLRVPLVHAGLRLGVLEMQLRPGAAEPPAVLIEVLQNQLAPFLDAMTLAEDLALEVASRSREIAEQRRFTALIIDSLPIGLYVIDQEYRIQIWNRKRETGTQGLRRDLVIGRPVFEVLTRQPEEQLKADFDRIFDTGEVHQREVEVEQGGEIRHFRLSRLPMRLDGEAITHVITIGEDVTESRSAEQQILQSEKLAAVGQLAAGVMHEINNPLATIGACVAAIDGRIGRTADATVLEYLEIIDKEVQRCTKIVDGLLEFSRPQGRERPKSPATINAVIEETLFLIKHHKRFKRLVVTTDLAPSLPLVSINHEQVIQLLMALMLNAVDAMDDGGTLTLRSRANPVRADEIIVEVEDTGHGIPSNEIPKIFEPFYTTKPTGRGTGLGLSICYAIVQDHRGRMEVDSEPGRGSTFRVYLPIEAGDAE